MPVNGLENAQRPLGLDKPFTQLADLTGVNSVNDVIVRQHQVPSFSLFLVRATRSSIPMRDKNEFCWADGLHRRARLIAGFSGMFHIDLG